MKRQAYILNIPTDDRHPSKLIIDYDTNEELDSLTDVEIKEVTLFHKGDKGITLMDTYFNVIGRYDSFKDIPSDNKRMIQVFSYNACVINKSTDEYQHIEAFVPNLEFTKTDEYFIQYNGGGDYVKVYLPNMSIANHIGYYFVYKEIADFANNTNAFTFCDIVDGDYVDINPLLEKRKMIDLIEDVLGDDEIAYIYPDIWKEIIDQINERGINLFNEDGTFSLSLKEMEINKIVELACLCERL